MSEAMGWKRCNESPLQTTYLTSLQHLTYPFPRMKPNSSFEVTNCGNYMLLPIILLSLVWATDWTVIYSTEDALTDCSVVSSSCHLFNVSTSITRFTHSIYWHLEYRERV